MSQERLVLAFPGLSGERQLEALLGTTAGEDVLRPLLDVMKPVDERTFDDHFRRACIEDDARREYFLLIFARGSGTPISGESRKRMMRLLAGGSALVRMVVLERVLHLRDEELMKCVVDGGWRAEDAEDRNSYENAYGSAVLVEGALRGWISVDEALARIASRHYGWAARRLGRTAARRIVTMVDVCIGAAAGVQAERSLPDVEYRCRREGQPDSFPYRLAEGELEAREMGELWKRDGENGQTFDEWQMRRQEAFDGFKRRLSDRNASIVVDDISKEEFEAIAKADTEAADRWCRVFLSLDVAARRVVHNLTVMLAYALRERSAKRAVELLRCVSRDSPLVRFVEGRARVPLEAMVAWSAAGGDAGGAWCYERLNMARNDHEIATEVLAALWNREEGVVKEFISDSLNRREPEGIARALLVAGLSNQEDENTKIIQSYEDARGFIGEAYKAGKYAYERDGWARYWFGKMCKTDDPAEFWRYSVLFGKVVDGRFMIWSSEYDRVGEAVRRFERSIDTEVDRRMEKWRKYREKTLFGSKRPPETFLPE